MGLSTAEKNIQGMPSYAQGERDDRSWGNYVVTNVSNTNEQERCEKIITVNAQQALSLQRHKYRSEIWKILEGNPTVIVNGVLKNLSPGDVLEVPIMAPHCIVNMGDCDVVIREMQFGICRENDNERLANYADRPTVKIDPNDDIVKKSIETYEAITSLLFSK